MTMPCAVSQASSLACDRKGWLSTWFTAGLMAHVLSSSVSLRAVMLLVPMARVLPAPTAASMAFHTAA